MKNADKIKVFEIGTGYTSIPAQVSAATEIVIEQLTRALLRQGVETVIVDVGDEKRGKTDLPVIPVQIPDEFYGVDTSLGIKHKAKRVVYSVECAKTLARIIRENDSAGKELILHFHNQYNLFFFYLLNGTKKRENVRIIYTNHSGIWGLPWGEIRGVILKKYFQEAFAMRKADHVFALNRRMAANIVRHDHVRADHVSCIANGVNPDVYRPLGAEERQRIRKKMGIEDKKVIVQVGSVCENKNQLYVAKRLTKFLKEHGDYVYAYAGGIVSAEYQEKIHNYSALHGITPQVRYYGMIEPGEELNAFYNAGDVSVIASNYEGFGLVILESLAAGVPVLRRDSIRYVGKFAGCIDFSDQDDLGNLAQDTIARKEELAGNARKEAAGKYSWDSIAEDYIDSVDRML